MLTVKKNPIGDVGVIVGRFQVNTLHEGHVDLINTIYKQHHKTIIFLGLAPTLATQNNPLDFECRKQMILERFPDINVLYIKDTSEDKFWVDDLDEKISDIVGPNKTVTLYGGRDSFIKHYTDNGGRYPTVELVQDTYISGTEIRESIGKKVKNTPEFRAGVIWSVYNRYPTVYTTVDVAILDKIGRRVLLARKPKEIKYRFVGGFSSPNSPSFEDDAKREVAEETGLEVGTPKYIGSYFINDWRYRNEVDKIKTLFFICDYIFGAPKASDDIVECRWFDLSKLTANDFVDIHVVLFEALKQHLGDLK